MADDVTVQGNLTVSSTEDSPEAVAALFQKLVADAIAAAIADPTNPLTAVTTVVVQDIKPIWKSKTVWSLGVAAAALIFQQVFGHTIGAGDQATLVNAISPIIELGGIIAGVFFRANATSAKLA